MRDRSVAATAAAAVLALLLGPTGARPSPPDDPAKVRNRVDLVLQISGLGPNGCEIEIEPGHPGCRFERVVRKLDKVASGNVVRTNPISIVAESASASRDCSFAITLREPGKPPRRYRRGVRLNTPTDGQPLPTQTLRCYLSTTALATRDEGSTTKR